MSTASPNTAAVEYLARLAETKYLIVQIMQQLAVHTKQQHKSPAHWGFVGDLGHVNEQLAYALASLGDHSALRRMGLPS